MDNDDANPAPPIPDCPNGNDVSKKRSRFRLQFSVGTLLVLTAVAAILVQQFHTLRIPIESSYIRSIGHSAFTNTLTVEFESGDIYQYSKVPRTVYRDFLEADSHGSFFHQHIKSASYAFEKVE